MAKKKSTYQSTKTTKRAPAKRATTKKRVIKKQNVKSFRVAKEPRPFLSAVFSDDSLHWIIIGALVITLTLWVATMQVTIHDIYNNIENSLAFD